MSKKPTILARTTLAQSRLFSIESLHLQFSNGQERHFERVMPGPGANAAGAVLIVPILNNESILLIKEYAAGTDRYELMFPKGLMEPEEDKLAAANRELMEEIGYSAGQISYVKTLATAPGHLSSRMHIVVATDLHPKRLEGDEPEPIEVVAWPLSDIQGLLALETFVDARSVAALGLVKERIE